MIKLLLKIPYFRKALVKAAFKITYIDSDNAACLTYLLSDSKGFKYMEYIRPDLMPYSRFSQIELMLLGVNSRFSRESMKLFADANESAARASDMLTVARLAAELNERLEVIYDPQLFMRILTASIIREDQINTAHIWNQKIEDEKFEQLMADNENGQLGFFFQKAGLMKYVQFTNSLNSDSENTKDMILNEQIIQNQLKEVRAFDQMMRKVSSLYQSK